MPLAPIHAALLSHIAANRNPDSYVAGATVLHLAPDSPRFSEDLDLFHDLEDSVAQSAETDAATLRAAGYELSWLLRTPSFHRALVTAAGEQLKIEWAHDSAFRFFPVQKDDLCGYRLHDADAATNKVLALAGRSEVRDFVDVVHLHATYLSLGALAWAACGKDPGYTPQFLLDYACRRLYAGRSRAAQLAGTARSRGAEAALACRGGGRPRDGDRTAPGGGGKSLPGIGWAAADARRSRRAIAPTDAPHRERARRVADGGALPPARVSYGVRYLPGMRVRSYSAAGSRSASARGIGPSQ